MILKYQSAKTRTNERHDETSERGQTGTAPNQMILSLMGGSDRYRLPADLRVEAEGHPGLREQFWELAGRLRYEGHAKKRYRHADGSSGLG